MKILEISLVSKSWVLLIQPYFVLEATMEGDANFRRLLQIKV